MIDRKRLRELASGVARRTGCVEWQTGYSDGSGPEIVTVNGRALLKSNWGCSCCESEATTDQLSLATYAAAADPTTVLSLLDTIERYEKALRFYANTSGKTKWVQGKIIEFDPDAGPLYERYEVPMCDDGEVAREALNPKEGE